jgi:hypothetical protein
MSKQSPWSFDGAERSNSGVEVMMRHTATFPEVSPADVFTVRTRPPEKRYKPQPDRAHAIPSVSGITFTRRRRDLRARAATRSCSAKPWDRSI